MRKTFISAAALVVAAGAANAQFSFFEPGPFNSAGPFGDPDNGVRVDTYAGANTIFGSVRVQGRLTSGGTGSWGSEARLDFRRVGGANGLVFNPGLPTGAFDFYDVDVTRSALFWANSGDDIRTEAYETFNDPGIDARWSDMTVTMNDAVFGNLGSFLPGDFDFDTFGSNFDTELALFALDGTLIAENDDAGGTLQSQIIENLGIGQYIIVVGGWNSVFFDGLASPGASSGDYLLNLNGQQVSSGVLESFQFASYRFDVVPAPASLALLGLGGLIAGRRRR